MPRKEMQHYKNAAEALKKCGPSIEHVIYSTLEETTIDVPETKDFKTLAKHSETGDMKVPHVS